MKHSEDSMSISVANYIRAQYPKVLFSHVPNGGKRSAREGARFKRMGVRKGIPDFLIFETNDPHLRGLALELKVKPNKPSPEQLEVIAELKRLKWVAEICYSFDETKKIIDTYLS